MKITRQKEEITAQKGLFNDATDSLIPEGGSPDLSNVEFYKGILRRTRAMKNLDGEILSGSIMGFKQFTSWSGSTTLIGFSDANIYRYNSSSNAWTSVGAYTGTALRHISSAIFANKLLWTDGENNIKQSSGGTIANLNGATHLKARHCASFYTHFFLGNVIEAGFSQGSRVQWCNVANPEQWGITTGSAGFVDLVDTPGHIMGFYPTRDRIFLWKSDSIWVGSYVGPPVYFRFVPLDLDEGLIATRTISAKKGNIFFMGTTGIKVFTGSDTIDITEGIWDELYGPGSILNTDYMHLSCGIYIPRLDEYWLVVPTGSDTTPKTIYRYHLHSKSWWKRTSLKAIYSFVLWSNRTYTSWDESQGTWNDFSGTWASLLNQQDSAFQTLLMGVST